MTKVVQWATGAVGAAQLRAVIDDPELDAALDAATDEAAARGVFGAPTMYVGDEMFFGNDRLDFVRASLENRKARVGEGAASRVGVTLS